MNITELAMLKKIAGGGNTGGGGTVDGLVIKTITFTDRPSAWEWLKTNHDKVFRSTLSTALSPVPTVFNDVTALFDEELTAVLFSSVVPRYAIGSSVTFDILRIEVGENGAKGILGACRLDIDATSTIDIDGQTDSTIPDEAWAAYNVKSTYYYIAEAESGGEEDNSPSCLVVVGNYSTEPFEITVKMLVENNEVVDSTGMANGYGEYAEFHNTQKGSVAILKTTLPVIVRDAYNQEIIYSNSEYVEVDEANQMTYVTIPMDCAVVEIVVALAE